MALQDVKICIVVQNRRSGAYGDGCDEAVDQAANGLPLSPAATVQRGSIVVVRCLGWQHHCPGEQTAQAPQVRLVPRPGEHLHKHRVADGDFAGKQLVDKVAGCGPGVSKELYPG